ncbi:MAG: hypothetical protein ACLQPD_36395 [Desulfomonilaceae bacterium]
MARPPYNSGQCCKKLIDVCAEDGGYILDAFGPLAESRPENVQAMYDFTRE